MTEKNKIISNINIPQQAINALESYGKILPFETNEITYPAISNHPDVFMCHYDEKTIIAPNTPSDFKKALNINNILFTEGQSAVGNSYPKTASYNAVVTDKYLIHNLKITDKTIIENNPEKQKINVNQAYTRCNLLPLNDNSFITSDKGIYNTLLSHNINTLLVNPTGITLPGFDNGFFGGACGVYSNNVFIVGSLNNYTDGEIVRAFLHSLNYNIIELFDGNLFDCGSLFIIN